VSHELEKHDASVIYSSAGPGGNCGVFAEATVTASEPPTASESSFPDTDSRTGGSTVPDQEFSDAAEVLELITQYPEQLRKHNARLKAQRDQAARLLHAQQHGSLHVIAGDYRCATQVTQRCRRRQGLLWKPLPGPSRTVLNHFATGTARMQTGLPTCTERPVGSRAPVC